jgi:beta-lactam-binding protein with PASTA domain
MVVPLAYVPSSQPARAVVAQYPRAEAKVKRGTRDPPNSSLRSSPASSNNQQKAMEARPNGPTWLRNRREQPQQSPIN